MNFTAFFWCLLLTSEQEHVNFLQFFLIIQIQIEEQKKICQCSNSIKVPYREHPAVNFTISLDAQSQDMMMMLMNLLMMMKMWVFCCPLCEMPYDMWSLNDSLRFTLFLLPLLLSLSFSSSTLGGCSCMFFTQSLFPIPIYTWNVKGGFLLWSGIKQAGWDTN